MNLSRIQPDRNGIDARSGQGRSDPVSVSHTLTFQPPVFRCLILA